MNEGPPGNPTRKCYGTNCPNEGKPLRRYYGKSLYWKSVQNYGYKGNNYFCSLRCGMDWAVIKCDAGSEID